MTISAFQQTILSWYKTNRRDLPWRNTKDPYRILVSEVMLQQTQVARVIPKYKEFLKAFPTLESLAKASDKKLLKTWAGLGYWRRALNLKEAAKQLVSHDVKNLRSWKFYTVPEQLDKLPGIGPYTAHALACFAFGSTEAFLDTNIRRVYLHFFFPRKKNVPDKEILTIAQAALASIPSSSNGTRYGVKINPREWHYALFDYGATVLKNNKANRRSKHYAKQSKFEGSFRSYRTKVVNFLLSQKQNRASQKTIEALLKESPYPKEKIITSLLKDRLIKQSPPASQARALRAGPTHYSL
ncbi:MAG: A/G-specific adenine glycosylase [Candidatus Wildermuthbacteria bacterium]|nr:A/G-specific adenine glycosylase [Candidatus Wildermuthbacteria bacterium]